MTGNRTWMLLNRLVIDRRLGLQMDYMGRAEFEFGATHAALAVITADIAMPVETIQTRIVPGEEHMPFAWKEQKARMARPRRGRRPASAWDDSEMADFAAMLDGRPLLLRTRPGLMEKADLEELLSVPGFSEARFLGSPWSRATRAWIALAPAAGILYHPSQEGLVDRFIAAVRDLRAEAAPDPAERRRKAMDIMLKNAERISLDRAALLAQAGRGGL